VFLDRDQTLIANKGDLGDPDQVVLLPGVAEGVAALHQAGWSMIVVTNQGGVARGVFSLDDTAAVARRIDQLLEAATGLIAPIAAWYSCPWHPNGTVPEFTREHPWRKPQPGMLKAAADDHGVELAASWMVGDSARDIEAGQRAGCRTVLLSDAFCDPPPTHRCMNLQAAAVIIGQPTP
jgi:histidinol-phosphate phosphatase family protein